MSSLWKHLDTRFTDDGNRSVAFFQADSEGFDVGTVLTAARRELPLMDRSWLVHDAALGSGSTFQVNREIFAPPEWKNDVSTSYYVAVKYVKLANKTKDTKCRLLRSVIREIQVMLHAEMRNHICIAPILAYGWVNDPKDGSIPYIVTDYSTYGTIRSYLERTDIPMAERRSLALDVAIGLSVLHDNGIAHGDVKQANVLVFNSIERFDEPDGRISRPQIAKLADFGSVIFTDDVKDAPLTYLGTPLYNAPEMQDWTTCTEELSFSACCGADVYSFGILLWEVMNRGEFFLSDLLTDRDTQPIDFLRELKECLPDALLACANAFCVTCELTGTILSAVQGTFELCLRDHPTQRASMDSVVLKLAEGTSAMRPSPTYPPTFESPVQARSELELSIPPGYFTRDLAPDVAIPIPSRARPEEPMHIKRYDPTLGEWVLTTELDGHRFSRTAALGSLERPNHSQSPWTDPQSLDLFQVTTATSPPWHVQCRIVDRLKSDALRENDVQKKANAHLQLSVSYHIGFGCSPAIVQTLRHLSEARTHNSVAQSLYHPVFAALVSEYRSLSTEKLLEDGFEQMVLNEEFTYAGYSDRIRSILKTSAHSRNRHQIVYCGQLISAKNVVDVISALGGTINASDKVLMQAADGTDSSLSLLDYAAGLSTGTLLEHLIEQVDYGEEELLQALITSCKAGLFERACAICRKCEKHSAPWDKIWPTPMHWLIAFDVQEAKLLAQLMVAKGSGPNSLRTTSLANSEQEVYVPELSVDLFGTPLHWAARTGNAALAVMLLDLGANIESRWQKDLLLRNGLGEKKSLSYSPLDVAVMWHHHEVVELLLNRGAETYGGDHQEQHFAICLLGAPTRPFARFAIHGQHSKSALERTITALTQGSCYLEAQNSAGETALHIAFGFRDQDSYVLETLLEAGCRHDTLPRNSPTALAKDSNLRRCSVMRMEMLLPLVENINAADENGKNALYYAAEASSSIIVERLLSDNRIDVRKGPSSAHNPLSAAAKNGNLDILARLIEAGAEIDACDHDGKRPLEHALESRQSAIVIKLASSGAATIWETRYTAQGPGVCNDSSLKSNNTSPSTVAKTALILATANEKQGTSILPEILDADKRLRKRSLLDWRDSNDWTALHHAAWFGDYDGVCALIATGANSSIPSQHGLPCTKRAGTPLQISSRLLRDLTELGGDGWKRSEIEWLSKGGPVRWNIYLSDLRKIVTVLERKEAEPSLMKAELQRLPTLHNI